MVIGQRPNRLGDLSAPPNGGADNPFNLNLKGSSATLSVLSFLENLRRRCDAVIVGEDCGGLGTFGKATKQLEVTGHVVRVDKAFVSESDPDLQQLLANDGYAIVTSDILDDNNGNFQPVHIYGLGWPCQPESRMGSKM